MPPSATDTAVIKPEILKPEEVILAELLRDGASISTIIPDDVDSATLWESFSLCCNTFTKLQRSVFRLGIVIGRMLLVYHDNPQRFIELGYPKWENFLADKIRPAVGIGRSWAFNAMRIAKRWPQLTLEDYERTGMAKLLLLCRFTDGTSSNGAKWLEAAKTHTETELKQLIAESGECPLEELQFARIEIVTSKAVAETWLDFVSMPEIQAKCGTADPGEILRCAVAECMAEWLNTIPELIEA